MKKFLFILLLPFTLLSQEWDDELFQQENDPPPFYPFSASGSFVDVSKTNFRTPGFQDRTLKYGQWEMAFAHTHPFNPCCGLIFGAGWIGTEVDMEENPAFNETCFNYVNLSCGVFSKAFPNWTWTLTLAAYLDVEEFSLVDYALYQGVLWGRYDFCKWIELDFGIIVEAGLKKEKVWPIIGFVYIPCDRWRISTVYPIDISVAYEIHSCLTLEGSIRFLRNRHRVKQDEPLSQGIFEYETAGAEIDLIFSPFPFFSATGFVGSTLKGDFKISDRNDHHSTHYKFNSSFYAGFSAILSF
jgi:hypothetical protein